MSCSLHPHTPSHKRSHTGIFGACLERYYVLFRHVYDPREFSTQAIAQHWFRCLDFIWLCTCKHINNPYLGKNPSE
jgi:hypothetical protein